MPIQRAKPRFTEVKNVSNITADKLSIGQIGGNRNILINGDMQIAQRGTSTTFAHDGTTSGYSVDRYNLALGGTHEQLDGTLAQVAEHPLSNALRKSIKWTTGTAETSYDADEYIYLTQKIEAQNVQHLNYGTSNAKSIIFAKSFTSLTNQLCFVQGLVIPVVSHS